MPNETLLAQLDALRDAYAQRDKTALALLAALKGTTNAHNKAAKALREYGEQDATVDVSGAQGAFGQLRLKEETIDPLAAELRRETKTLAGLVAALKDAGAALRSEPVDVVRLDKALTALQTSSEQKILDIRRSCGKNWTWPSACWATNSGRNCGPRWPGKASAWAGAPPSSRSVASSSKPTSPNAS